MVFGRAVDAALFGALLVIALGVSGGDCARGGTGTVPRCGPCERSSECRQGLSCVNGNCQTAPPTCHVDFGI
jgi:hypothetical protein